MFARRIRIQRKKKPWLHAATKRNMTFANFNLQVLKTIANYGGGQAQGTYENARIEKIQAQTELTVLQQSQVAERIRRLELQNEELIHRLKSKGVRPTEFEAVGYDNWKGK